MIKGGRHGNKVRAVRDLSILVGLWIGLYLLLHYTIIDEELVLRLRQFEHLHIDAVMIALACTSIVGLVILRRRWKEWILNASTFEQAREALQDQTARLRRVTEDRSFLLWITQAELRILTLYVSGQKFMNIDVDAYVGNTLYALFDTYDVSLPPIATHIQAMKGISSRYEYPMRGCDFDVRVEPMRDASGSIIGTISLAVDVTDGKMAEAEVKVLKKLYETTLNDLPFQIAVLDPDARYRYVNTKALPDKETRDWLVGKSIIDYYKMHGLNPVRFLRRHRWIQTVIKEKKKGRLEETLVSSSGDPVYILHVAIPVLNDEGEVSRIISYGQDITEQKRREQRLYDAIGTQDLSDDDDEREEIYAEATGVMDDVDIDEADIGAWLERAVKLLSGFKEQPSEGIIMNDSLDPEDSKTRIDKDESD